jgi:tetratricopeptide (TPR) repeat protein
MVPVAEGARFEEAVEPLLGNGASEDAILVLYMPGHTLVDRADAEPLALSAAFAHTDAAAEDTVEQIIEDAEAMFDRDDWNGAERAFRKALSLLSDEVSVRRAEVLAGLGEIARLHGRATEASALLDRALAMSPTHPAALRGRASLARGGGEHAIAAALLQRLADVEENPNERGELLATVAAESLEAARQAIKKALELRPKDVALLERMRAAHEASGKWNDAVTVSVELAEAIPDRTARARALATAADVCANRAKNVSRAVALYEAAISDDPQVPGAFESIEATLVQSADGPGLADAYQRQIERLEGEGAAGERANLLQRLAVLYRDQLRDTDRAIQAFDQLIREDPDSIGARLDLSDLLRTTGNRPLSIRALEVAAERDPLMAAVYHRLFRLFTETKDADRGYAASAALVALGEADGDEQLVYSDFAPHSPLGFTRSFDDDVWQELLPDPVAADVEAVFAAIEQPCIDAWLAREERKGPLPMPPKNSRQDPATTTVLAVRSFVWASNLLGVPKPELYAAPNDARISTVTLPTRTPTVLLGRSVLTGRSPIELVFVAARHAAYVRPGRRLLAFYPTPEDLEPLVRAAIAFLRPDLVPAGTLPPIAMDVGARLDRALQTEQRARLAAALGRLWTSGGTMDLAAWMRTVERSSCRAALLATGDITVARSLLSASSSATAGLSAADRVRDLLAFSVSQRYSALRRMLGVGL